MPASIGVNLRVTGHCRQGGRKYMEDFFSVAYQQTEDERDLEYAFFGIYDGHGGAEAAAYAKEHLMEAIVRHKNFWSDNDEDVLRAIKDGYIATHYAMWKEQEKWPKTAAGLPSTAGTTASVAFIRKGKIYIGHVGDSGIILGYQDPDSPDWKAKALTQDHKPENAQEMMRIEQCGGKVVTKSGVPRVVWNRPRIGHQGPVRRSTLIDEIPFLAVARSLGDLWSYNSQLNEFVVSPDPDCSVIPIDTSTFRCLIFGTDGLYNMLSPQMAVHIVQQAEKHNENVALGDSTNKVWLNPSRCLVDKALERWSTIKMRADNTSVVTLMLDPPGPPRAQVLRNKRKNNYADSGLEIMTRYEDNETFTPKPRESTSFHPKEPENLTEPTSPPPPPPPSITTTKPVIPSTPPPPSPPPPPTPAQEENIQINEISSSSNDDNTKPVQRMSLRSTTEDSKPKRQCCGEDCSGGSGIETKRRKCEKKIAEKEVTIKKRNAIRRVMRLTTQQPISSEAVSSSNSTNTKENIKPQPKQKRSLRLKNKVSRKTKVEKPSSSSIRNTKRIGEMGRSLRSGGTYLHRYARNLRRKIVKK